MCPETFQEVPEKTLSKGKSDIKKKNPISDQTKQKESEKDNQIAVPLVSEPIDNDSEMW